MPPLMGDRFARIKQSFEFREPGKQRLHFGTALDLGIGQRMGVLHLPPGDDQADQGVHVAGVPISFSFYTRRFRLVGVGSAA